MVKDYNDRNDYAKIRIETEKNGKELPTNLKAEKKLRLSHVRTCYPLEYDFYIPCC